MARAESSLVNVFNGLNTAFAVSIAPMVSKAVIPNYLS